jgi:hypothetical protein
MGKQPFTPYTLGSVKEDLVGIKSRLEALTNNMSPEPYTLESHRQANEICQKIHMYLENGNKVEIILRKV